MRGCGSAVTVAVSLRTCVTRAVGTATGIPMPVRSTASALGSKATEAMAGMPIRPWGTKSVGSTGRSPAVDASRATSPTRGETGGGPPGLPRAIAVRSTGRCGLVSRRSAGSAAASGRLAPAIDAVMVTEPRRVRLCSGAVSWSSRSSGRGAKCRTCSRVNASRDSRVAAEQLVRVEDLLHLLPAPLDEVLLVLPDQLGAEPGRGPRPRVEVELAQPPGLVGRHRVLAYRVGAVERRAEHRGGRRQAGGHLVTGRVERLRERGGDVAGHLVQPRAAALIGAQGPVHDEVCGRVARVLGRQLGTGGPDVHRLPAALDGNGERAQPAGQLLEVADDRAGGELPRVVDRQPDVAAAEDRPRRAERPALVRLTAEPADDPGVEGGDEAGGIPSSGLQPSWCEQPRHVHRRPGAPAPRRGPRRRARPPGYAPTPRTRPGRAARWRPGGPGPRGRAAAGPAGRAAVRRRRGRRPRARTTAAAGRPVRSSAGVNIHGRSGGSNSTSGR